MMFFDPHVERKALVDGFMVWACCKVIIVKPCTVASRKRVEAMGLEKAVERLLPSAILEEWTGDGIAKDGTIRYIPKSDALRNAVEGVPGWILARDENDASFQAYEFVEDVRFLELPEYPFYFPTSHRKLKVCTWSVYRRRHF